MDPLDDLINEKSLILYELNFNRDSFTSEEIFDKTQRAADCEGEIAEILLTESRIEEAVINLVSQGSLLVNLGTKKEAKIIFQRAMGLTSIKSMKKWIRGYLQEQKLRKNPKKPNKEKPELHKYTCITFRSLGESTFASCEREAFGPKAPKFPWKRQAGGFTYGFGPPDWSEDIDCFSLVPKKESPYLRRYCGPCKRHLAKDFGSPRLLDEPESKQRNPSSNPLHRGPPIDPDSEFLPWIPHGKLINLGNNKWQCPTCSMISSKPSFEILRCFKPHNWITNLAKKYGLIKKQWHLHTHASAWQCNYCQMTSARFEDFEEIQCPYTPEPCKYCGDTPICAQDCLGIAAALSGELTPDVNVKFLGPGQEPPNVNPSSLENLDPENIKHLCLDCQKVYQGPEDAPITSHGYCPSCGKLQLQKLQAMKIHQEILKVNQLAETLQTWNLKYDVFPSIEPPKLPYGIPEATDFLSVVAEIQSQNYWGLISDSSKLDSATQRWHNMVKDLAGEYGLKDLYAEPWLSC